MKSAFPVFSILIGLSLTCLANQAMAAESPAYRGLTTDDQTLVAAVKALKKEDQVVCQNVFFIRIDRSTKVVMGGMCAIKGAPTVMACLNGDSGKTSVADRSYPELTEESEVRMLMHDGCDL